MLYNILYSIVFKKPDNKYLLLNNLNMGNILFIYVKTWQHFEYIILSIAYIIISDDVFTLKDNNLKKILSLL